jgi:ribose 5-phosphate isomerase RpiB
VISDNQDYAVAALNYINSNGHTAIISETISEDAKSQLNDLRANIGSGFDIIIMLCANAKDLAISANKIGNSMAVVCKDQDDALEAIGETRANVIIIDTSKLDRRTLSSILSGLLSEVKAEAKKETPVRERRAQPERYVEEGPGITERTGSFLSNIKNAAGDATSRLTRPPAPKPITRAKGAPKAPQGDGVIKSIKSKGLMKHLKETFGIIDE